MAEASPWIAIVDDDSSVLKALTRLLRTRGLRAKTYGSAREFLAALPSGAPERLVVFLPMPQMSGLELLPDLAKKDVPNPTIIITAHGDIGVRERCLAAGAAAFLLKPLQDKSLFAAIEAARKAARHGPDRS